MESRGNKISEDLFLVLMLGVWTILNIFQAVHTDLSADESYYYILSQHPSLGYFDHPPMNMWIVYLSTFFFGNSELGIRLLTVLLQPVYLYLFWQIIKSENSKHSSALLYVLIAFSMPLLQVYGWVSTPDAPLMFFAALLLWSYKRFTDNDRLGDALIMGVSIALLGYSKYHGALFVGLLLLSNVRILLSWKFWLGVLLAVVLYLPHIYWQYTNDWVSFVYHLSGRTDAFEWENFWVYILNLATTFNPFFALIIILFLVKGKRLYATGDVLGRALKWEMIGFVLFFLWSVRNVHVQAQWLILVSYSVMYFVFTLSERNNKKLRSFVKKLGGWMIVLFLVARLFLMLCPPGVADFDMVGSKPKYEEFAQKLDTMPFIGNSNYQFSSKLAYYGDILTYGRPSLDSRSSHYEFLDMEDLFKGKTIAVEISQYAKNPETKLGIPIYDTVVSKRNEKKRLPNKRIIKQTVKDTNIVCREYHYDNILGYDIVWDTIQNYLPTEKIKIKASNMPSKIRVGEKVLIDFEISNPYEYDIPLRGAYSYKLYLNIKYGRFSSRQILIRCPLETLPAGSICKFQRRFAIPSDVPSGKVIYGYSILRMPFGGWYNSERRNLIISNPSKLR